MGGAQFLPRRPSTAPLPRAVCLRVPEAGGQVQNPVRGSHRGRRQQQEIRTCRTSMTQRWPTIPAGSGSGPPAGVTRRPRFRLWSPCGCACSAGRPSETRTSYAGHYGRPAVQSGNRSRPPVLVRTGIRSRLRKSTGPCPSYVSDSPEGEAHAAPVPEPEQLWSYQLPTTSPQSGHQPGLANALGGGCLVPTSAFPIHIRQPVRWLFASAVMINRVCSTSSTGAAALSQLVKPPWLPWMWRALILCLITGTVPRPSPSRCASRPTRFSGADCADQSSVAILTAVFAHAVGASKSAAWDSATAPSPARPWVPRCRPSRPDPGADRDPSSAPRFPSVTFCAY